MLWVRRRHPDGAHVPVYRTRGFTPGYALTRRCPYGTKEFHAFYSIGTTGVPPYPIGTTEVPRILSRRDNGASARSQGCTLVRAQPLVRYTGTCAPSGCRLVP